MLERLTGDRPAGWNELPDLELYRDQVLAYMTRQQTMQDGDDKLTGAMVNNYIKNGLLPRANGKKYNRDHLAYLTIICALKQVLSVSDADRLIKMRSGKGGIGEFYTEYCETLGSSLDDVLTTIRSVSPDELGEMAFDLAITSYSLKMACERILDIYAGDAGIAPDGSKINMAEEKTTDE